MSNIDIAVTKAIQELERIENSSGAINLYTSNNTYTDNKLGLTDEFASEIASEIADKIEKNRRKQVLRSSIISLLKAGHSIQLILSIEGISEHFSIEEILELKNTYK